MRWSTMAKVLGGKGFDNVMQDEVINVHFETLTDKDLSELTKPASEEEDELGLALERLSNLLRTGNEVQGKAKAWDPYMVQSLQLKNAVDAAMQTYKTPLITMKKQ
ncbi:Hypothetical predicted protein [Octopus vulgaris]|uniref:Uncharacterized protein n=1 Tax=Octopus vulgaris TaxID=6645 RepID=A0AA36BB51_OCTVU|nr:Hypothetical predicted protein [Octopus vulgaris]